MQGEAHLQSGGFGYKIQTMDYNWISQLNLRLFFLIAHVVEKKKCMPVPQGRLGFTHSFINSWSYRLLHKILSVIYTERKWHLKRISLKLMRPFIEIDSSYKVSFFKKVCKLEKQNDMKTTHQSESYHKTEPLPYTALK